MGERVSFMGEAMGDPLSHRFLVKCEGRIESQVIGSELVGEQMTRSTVTGLDPVTPSADMLPSVGNISRDGKGCAT